VLNEPPPEALSHFPPLYATQTTEPEETVIHAHFFIGSCDWYAAEFDGEDTFFGFVNLGDPDMAEWGYFSLTELKSVRVKVPVYNGATGVCIGGMLAFVEWDEYWKPRPFAAIRERP
jgi:hypothetical protein